MHTQVEAARKAFLDWEAAQAAAQAQATLAHEAAVKQEAPAPAPAPAEEPTPVTTPAPKAAPAPAAAPSPAKPSAPAASSSSKAAAPTSATPAPATPSAAPSAAADGDAAPAHLSADQLKERGKLYYEQKDFAAAAAAWEAAVVRACGGSKDFVVACQANVAQAKLQLGDWEGALKHTDAVLQVCLCVCVVVGVVGR